MNKIIVYILFGIFALIIFSNAAASASWDSEEKMLFAGGTWEKSGWNLSIRAVDKTAAPGSVIISLSYMGKNLEDSRVEKGKSIMYIGRDPDGSEVPLFAVKLDNIFVGKGVDAVKLELNWTKPNNDVQVIEVPVGSDIEAKTTASMPAAQASPEASGFGIILAIMGFLAVMMYIRKT